MIGEIVGARRPVEPCDYPRCDIVDMDAAEHLIGQVDAVRLALAEMPSPPPLLVTLTPRSWVAEDRAWLAAHVPADTGYAVPSPTDPVAPSVVDDALVTHEVVDLITDLAADRDPTPSFADGLQVQLVLDAVARSAAAGSGWQPVDIAEEA